MNVSAEISALIHFLSKKGEAGLLSLDDHSAIVDAFAKVMGAAADDFEPDDPSLGPVRIVALNAMWAELKKRAPHLAEEAERKMEGRER